MAPASKVTFRAPPGTTLSTNGEPVVFGESGELSLDADDPLADLIASNYAEPDVHPVTTQPAAKSKRDS